MRLFIVLSLCFSISSTAVKTIERKCIDDDPVFQNRSKANKREEDNKCKSNLTIEDKDDKVVLPFYNDLSVRFNQMQRLHLIGGSVVCDDEIEHALIRLLYLYSCIFPTIQKLNNSPNDWIVFQDISNLDQNMQRVGREKGLHQHSKGEEKELKDHLINFIHDLKETNGHEEGREKKLYRSFCTNNPSRQKHADSKLLQKKDEDADQVSSETKSLEG